MLQKLFYTYIVKPMAEVYLRFNVRYSFDGFRLRVFPGVFHPGLFFSSTFLYSFLKKNNLGNKTFLEIGCGSGLISMLAYRQGAQVTAIDLNPKAVENTRANFLSNFRQPLSAHILESDLFQNIGQKKFDLIAINPPYFFKHVESDQHLAWYCGKNGEYFQKLFAALPTHVNTGFQAWMVLAENCEIERISAIANNYNYKLVKVEERQIKWEMNYIYQIKPIEV